MVNLPVRNRIGCISEIHYSLHKTSLASREKKQPQSNSCVLAESILPWATLLHGYKLKATLRKISYSFEITIVLYHCSAQLIVLFNQLLMAGV